MRAARRPEVPAPAPASRRRVSGKRTLALMLVVGVLVIGTVVAVTAGGLPSFHAPRVLVPNHR